MTSLIRNLLSEFVQEKRFLKNCSSFNNTTIPNQQHFTVSPSCIQIVIEGSHKILYRQKNRMMYKVLSSNDVVFIYANNYVSTSYVGPVTILTIRFENQHLNCNLLKWDGNHLVMIEEIDIGNKDPDINKTIMQALYELTINYDERFCAIKIYKLLILSLLNNIVLSLSIPLKIHTNKKIKLSLIRQYINEHFQETITREKLAELFHLSPNYLSSLFHKEEKIGLNEYILQTKLQYAKKLLLNNELNISDIALASGFQDDNYFRRIFRKKIGCTPSEFKNQRK